MSKNNNHNKNKNKANHKNSNNYTKQKIVAMNQPKMVFGKTSNGFSFEIDPLVMDNMELVDVLAEMNDDNPLAVSKVCHMVLGDTQKKALYDFLRTSDNRVPVVEVVTAIKEIFLAIGSKGKNS